ncbi:histidine kinase [Saccharospirillum sp. MSK14-1]|uniref:ATP-binding protein n=1 Tax=Saccharospirillum sp. MSK14-1 TaxID=1897632 RepID=UPI000D39FAC0|nr:sensor histidine kinase [Saccharospirillum sp. MSK14-1]PTY38290.1 histidine kinase [Saccharospirillum sp. MSK14-1]
MILVLGLVSAAQTGLIGGFAWQYLSRSLDDQIGQRALMVAKTIAAMPGIINGIEQRDTAALQRLSKKLARTNEALFIVIGDANNIRLAHPNPDRIGHSMADDDGDRGEIALLDGRAYVNKAHGSLGESMRGKAPVFDNSGNTIVGLVSVGYSLDQVRATINRYKLVLIVAMTLMLMASVAAAIIIAGRFKKAIFGLEPEQIARLFEELDATLQSVREGIVAVNRDGQITTVNRTAIETLGLAPDTALVGTKIDEILPDSGLLPILDSGESQFDQEVWLNGRLMIVNRLPVKQEGELIGVVSSFRLRDELDQVSRQLTRIQQYADTLRSQTHEYSNKLHTIAGLIQLGAHDEALALIGSEVSDHQALIQLLLEAVPDPVLAGCLLGKYNRAREMGLLLIIDPDSRMTELPDSLPRDQLVSVVGNLIDNALEATRQSSPNGGQVQLSMTDLGHDLIFEVEDQGPGIPNEQRERIFEKGVTTKSDNNHGLGLHLVRSFVARWGGSITVEVLQTGSRFTLYLPKQPDGEADA